MPLNSIAASSIADAADGPLMSHQSKPEPRACVPGLRPLFSSSQAAYGLKQPAHAVCPVSTGALVLSGSQAGPAGLQDLLAGPKPHDALARQGSALMQNASSTHSLCSPEPRAVLAIHKSSQLCCRVFSVGVLSSRRPGSRSRAASYQRSHRRVPQLNHWPLIYCRMCKAQVSCQRLCS